MPSVNAHLAHLKVGQVSVESIYVLSGVLKAMT